MKFIFHQNEEDLIDLSRNSPVNKKIMTRSLLLVIVILIFSFFMHGVDVLLTWIIPIAIIIPLTFFIFRRAFKKVYKDPGNRKTLLGRRELELNEDEISIASPVAATTYNWSVITTLCESKRSYFLYMGNIQALILPKRVFRTEEEREGFVELVNRNISKS